MAIKKFNSVGGFSVGENDIVVIDTIGNVAAANLTVGGNATITGNLTVSGNISYLETEIVYVTDPIVEQGGGPNGAELTGNDGKDRGTLLHYYDGYNETEVGAFIGWDNSNAEFALASNVGINNDVVTFNQYGNVRVGNIFAGNITATEDLQVNGNISAIGNLQINGTISATAITGALGNAIPLGDSIDEDLVNPGTVTKWTSETKVTDAIDDLNEAMENVRNNTYVKSVAFTGTPRAGGAGSVVTLTITRIGNPNKYDVSWGDGTYSNGIATLTPTHTYATNTNSPFTVSVRGYNDAGLGTGSEASVTASEYITIYTANPAVSFNLYRVSTGGTILTGSTRYVTEGETFYLENTTTNTSGATVTYTINWGDGTTDTISGDSAAGGVSGSRKSHVYATGQNSGTGTKNITLTLTTHNTCTPSILPISSIQAVKIYNPSISAPDGLNTKMLTFGTSVGASPYLASNYTDRTTSPVLTAGSVVNRTVATTGTIDSTVLSSYAYNADAGTLSTYLNESQDSVVTLTTSDNSGTSGSLVITSESDYNLLLANGTTTTFALSTYKPTLFKGFQAKVSALASTVQVGLNSMKLTHSVTGSTNTVEYVKDDVVNTPTVDVTNATISNATNGTYLYISGIPYYNTGSPTITLAGANIYDWIGQTYQNTATPFQIEPGINDEGTTGNVIASQTKTYINLDGATTFLNTGIPKADTGKTSGSPYTIGNQTISVGGAAGTTAVQTVKFRATNVNGSGTYATHAKKVQVFNVAPSGFIENNISVSSSLGSTYTDKGLRVVIAGATGATPTYVNSTNYYTSSVWAGAQTIAGTDEAVVRWNQLKNFAVDLSGHLPAGPNLATGRSGTQYFRGAFRRAAVSSFNVTITGKISGFYIAAPGTTIDSTSTLNGWLNASLQYAGSGVPGVNTGGNGSNGCAVTGGDIIPTGSVITNTTYRLTLGSESLSRATGNQLLFSIALAPGDYVTAWSFS